jgi:hypothetical protein
MEHQRGNYMPLALVGIWGLSSKRTEKLRQARASPRRRGSAAHPLIVISRRARLAPCEIRSPWTRTQFVVVRRHASMITLASARERNHLNTRAPKLSTLRSAVEPHQKRDTKKGPRRLGVGLAAFHCPDPHTAGLNTGMRSHQCHTPAGPSVTIAGLQAIAVEDAGD